MVSRAEKDLLQISTLKHCNKKKRGFTIIEIMVVLVIAGAILTFGFQILQTLGAGNLTPAAPMQFEGTFKMAREYAMSRGETLTFELNLDSQQAGLRKYDHRLENEADTTLNFLFQGRESKMYKFRNENRMQASEEDAQPEWITRPQNLPGTITNIYSVSGMKLKGPVIYAHFYPNGTSDSLILQLDEEEKYLYLPRQNIPARFLHDLKLNSLPEIQSQPQ